MRDLSRAAFDAVTLILRAAYRGTANGGDDAIARIAEAIVSAVATVEASEEQLAGVPGACPWDDMQLSRIHMAVIANHKDEYPLRGVDVLRAALLREAAEEQVQ